MPNALPSLSVAGSGRLTAEAEIRFAYEADSQEAGMRLRPLLDTWADLGRRGGFDHPALEARDLSTLEVVGESISPRLYSVRLSAVSIDHRAYQLLRNAASRMALRGVEVRSIVVRQQAEAEPLRLPIPDEFNEPDVYPSLSPHIYFPLEFEDSDFSKSRRLLVELQGPVGADDVVGIGEWIQPWNAALEAGAYALPVGLPTEFDSLRGSTQQFDQLTIEISVMCFKASEMAWHALVNCVAAYGRRHGRRIARVVID